MKSYTFLRKVSLAGVLAGGLIYLVAVIFNESTAQSETVVGANIGAGLLALLGIAVGIGSIILFLATVIAKKIGRRNS